MIKQAITVFAILALFPLVLEAQETVSGGTGAGIPESSTSAVSSETDAQEGDGELLPETDGDRLEPVFPATSTALITVEAEDAVTTNFAKQPTLNYGASGFRTLQLNRYTALSGGDSFFAEFVVYAEKPGTYELWYGGTPPGPREDVFPSYASPFAYRIDNRTPVSVYREDVRVVEGYAPAFYWVQVGEVILEAGMHTIRFAVSEKRRFDGKFFFYLDSLFLVDRSRFRQDSDPSPEVFPTDLESSTIDAPFRSISDYEYFISQDPDNPDVYVELSLIYSLIGDYNNALKNLNRAALIDPSNPEIQLLTAKNRIWKGDAAEGLRVYERLLQIDPSQVDIWAEAGKVSAWIGRYRESIQFYRSGLRNAPDSLNLMVNLGITYLWDTQVEQAETMFDQAEELAFKEIEEIPRLGEIYMVNGYPDLAIETYRSAIREFPEHLELYLSLEDAYDETGRTEDAERIHEQISERFVASERLDAYLDTFRTKQTMKQEVIAGYQRQLDGDPDNLDLRELLVQTYFWNGLRSRAIDEYLSILTNYAYRAFLEYDRRNADLYETIDRLFVRDAFHQQVADASDRLADDLESAIDRHEDATKANDRYVARVAAAKEKGEEPPLVEGPAPGEVLSQTESALANSVRRAEEFSSWVASTIASFDELDGVIEPFLEEEQQAREAFAQVTSAIAWNWDRRATLQELETVASEGVVLADHVLSRIRLFEGDVNGAIKAAERIISADQFPKSTLFALGQARHWTDTSPAAEPYWPEEVFTSYLDYTGRINRFVREVAIPDVDLTGFFSDSTPLRAAELIPLLSALRQQTEPPREALNAATDTLRQVLERRMNRLWYQIDQDTYLLRFELGDYLLLEERYREAITEFEKVLAIDPWNTSATFKLGTLHQLAGEWREAMRKYQQVYFADPKFENAAGNYNDLARMHADSLAFENSVMADSSRIGYQAEASFTNALSGSFGIDLDVSSDTMRRYQAFAGVLPGTYQVHRIGLDLPISLAAGQATITPVLGLSFVPSLLTDSVTVSSEAARPGAVLGSFAVEPLLGAEIGVNAGPVYIGGVYRYGRVEETLYPEAARVTSHTGELNAVVSFGFLDIPLLRYSSARTYGKVDVRSHDDGTGNLIFAVAQDLTQVFHLSDAPWTNLTVAGSAVFERASDTTVEAYYAPEDVLLLKGSVGIATWLSVGGGNVLGLSARTDAGLYAVDAFNPGTSGDLSLEASGRIEYTKGDSTYYLDVLGSSTIDRFPEFEYWSGSLRLGYTARLPRLLAE